jgi:hypothetical protein
MAYWGYTLGAGGAEKSPRKFPIQPSPSPRCNLRELRLDGQRAQCKGEKKKRTKNQQVTQKKIMIVIKSSLPRAELTARAHAIRRKIYILAGARCGFAAAGCVANRQLLDDPRLSVCINYQGERIAGSASSTYFRTFSYSVSWSRVGLFVPILRRSMKHRQDYSHRVRYSVSRTGKGAHGPPQNPGYFI